MNIFIYPERSLLGIKVILFHRETLDQFDLFSGWIMHNTCIDKEQDRRWCSKQYWWTRYSKRHYTHG